MPRDTATLPAGTTLVAVFTSLVLHLSACKPGESSDVAGASSNGNEAPAGTYPGVGLLSLLDATGSPAAFCSGVFVRDDLVMTVAHCFAGVKFGRIKIATNSGALHNRNPSSVTYTVDPKFDNTQIWNGKLPADVAFVQFAPGTAEPALIARLGVTEPGVGADVVMVGYAETKLNDPTSAGPRYVVHTKVNTIKQVAGNALLSAPIQVAPMSYNTADTPDIAPGGIVGDSGGPLFNEAGEVVGMSVGSIDLDSAGGNGNAGSANGGGTTAVPVPASSPPAAAAAAALALDDQTVGPAKVFTFVNIRNANAAPFIAQALNIPKLKAPPAATGAAGQGAGTAANTATAVTPAPATAQAPGITPIAPLPTTGPVVSPTGVYTDPTSGQTFPFCASASSADSRYPGWGWENDKSCKVQ